MGELAFFRNKFKVAKIVDEFSIVINGGEYACVHEGDRFEIYDPGVSVKDPDSGNNLGALEYVKATIVAQKVYDRMALCQSEDIVSNMAKNIASGLPMKHVELNVDAESISGGFDNKIRVGDFVRKISGEGIPEKKPETIKVPFQRSDD